MSCNFEIQDMIFACSFGKSDFVVVYVTVTEFRHHKRWVKRYCIVTSGLECSFEHQWLQCVKVLTENCKKPCPCVVGNAYRRHFCKRIDKFQFQFAIWFGSVEQRMHSGTMVLAGIARTRWKLWAWCSCDLVGWLVGRTPQLIPHVLVADRQQVVSHFPVPMLSEVVVKTLSMWSSQHDINLIFMPGNPWLSSFPTSTRS